MAWTAPTTQTTGTLITAAIWNTDLVDNLTDLKDPPSDNAELNEGSDYTETSTSFADIDSTEGKFKHTIITNGGDIMVGFHGNIRNTGGSIFLEIDVDGSPHAGDDGLIGQGGSVAIPANSISFFRIIPGLSAASHIFKLQWKVSAGTGTLFVGAGTGSGDLHPQFWVREIS